MRKLFLPALSLIFVLCSSFIKPKYFVEVWLPVQDSSWVVGHYDKQIDSIYLELRTSYDEQAKYHKSIPASERPSIKKIYNYSFKELDKLCVPLKDYNFIWEKDACIIIKHVGCFESAYKLKLSVKGNKKQEKLKQLIVQLK